MLAYASNTGTRNIAALRAAGWRILLSPDRRHPDPPTGIQFGIDNGAWAAFQQKAPFDTPAFEKLLNAHGAAADFIVIPDIVAGGLASLEFSESWISRLIHFRQILLPLQDGMEARHVGHLLAAHSNLGLFLGGSTEFKLREIYAWGLVAASWDRWYHVGRVNTARRIRLCAEAGATSFDGTSATMYSCTLPLLENARRQPSLLRPARTV